MKKIFNYMLAATIAAFTFTSCEDVPEPYPIPGGGHGGGTELPEGTYVKESFSKDFGTFSVYTVEGTPWTIDFSTAKASGYDNTSQVTTPSKSYLVSPAIDLTNSTGAYIEFEYIYRYNRAGAENKTFITDNYTGDPTTTAWTDITGTLIEGTDWTTFEEFKANLPEQFIGKSTVVIAFYYACNSQNSATIEIKNLVVKEGSIEDVPEENPETPTPGEAKGKGTLEDPFNSIAANKVASALSDSETTDVVYIKGKVATIREQYGTQYGNATFTISDDGTTTGEFLVYRALYLNNVKYTEGEVLHVGDEVVVCGKLCNYMGNTPETVTGEAYLFSLTCNGGTEEPDQPEQPGQGGEDEGNSITLIPSEMGYSNAQDMTTITLSDGTTLTFDAGGNQNGPKYYNTGKGIRMYPKNSMKVSSSKKIASIVMTVDVYNGDTYNASGDLQANPGTTAVSDNIVTFGGINNQECTITNTSTTTGAPSQVRMTQLKIVYAE